MSTRRRITLLSLFLATALAAFIAGTQVGELMAAHRVPDVTITIGEAMPPIFN